MTSTVHHTPHTYHADLTSVEINRPLGQLDAAIETVITTGSGTATTLTAQAGAGQASLTVASSAGFAPGDPIYIGTGAMFESRIVNTVPGDGVTITVTANLSNTYAAGKPVSKSPVEIVAARGGFTTLGARIGLIEGRVFHVKRYGAVGDGVADDTAALLATVAACLAAGGGEVHFGSGTFKFNQPLVPYSFPDANHVTVASLVGLGADTQTVLWYTGTGAAIRYVGTGAPEGNWPKYFRLEGFKLYSPVDGILLSKCGGARVNGVALRGGIGDPAVLGNSSATGDGFIIDDVSGANFYNCRALNYDSGFRILGTTYQPGGYIFTACAVGYGTYGWRISTTGVVIDSIVWVQPTINSVTSRAISLVGPGPHWNYNIISPHFEQGSGAGIANTAYGLYVDEGAIAVNLRMVGAVLWMNKYPIFVAGTVHGLHLDSLFLSANGVTAPGTAIDIGSGVSNFYLGAVQNSSLAPYPVLLADASDSATRAKPHAGGIPTAYVASAALTLGTSLADVAGCTLTATPLLPETWVVNATFDMIVGATDPGALIGRIVYDGSTTTGGAAAYITATAGRATVHCSAVIAVTAGTAHTVKLQASKSGAGGTASAGITNTRMVVQRVGG